MSSTVYITSLSGHVWVGNMNYDHKFRVLLSDVVQNPNDLRLQSVQIEISNVRPKFGVLIIT